MAVPEEESSINTQSSSATAAAPTPPSSSGDICYLAKCVLRPSVVLQVAYGYFRSRSFRDIVLGKETCIELVSIGEDGVVQYICEQSVFGTIKDLAVIPRNNKFQMKNTQMSGKDLLVVISDSGKLSFLSFSNDMHRFSPVSHVQLSSPGNSRLQLGRMLAVDSSGLFLAASAYHDQFVLFSLSMSSMGDISHERMFYPSENRGSTSSEQAVSGTIWSMCFISKDSHESSMEYDPVLAIVLNRKRSLMNVLVLIKWNIKEKSICLLSEYTELGALAHSIVEVPHSNGFAFLFRVGDALLMDLRDATKPCYLFRTSLDLVPTSLLDEHFLEEACRAHDGDDEGLFNVAACALLELRDYDPMCIDSENGVEKVNSKHVTSWTWAPGDDHNPKMIFCLNDGEFFKFEISYDADGVKVILSECLYQGLPCKKILWVEGGFVAAFMEMSDGIVFKVGPEKLHWASPIQNIAPILDMSVMDDQNEKQNQMFACCGVTPEGSMRIIRSGINVEKLLKTAPIYQGITGTWTVRMKLSDVHHSFLILSFVEESRVLSVGLSFKDVTDSVGFQPDVCTLACGLVADGLLVQIHRDAVRLCMPTKDAHSEGIPEASPFCSTWFPESVSISLGAVGENLIIVSTSNPCFLSVLGVSSLSSDHYEIYELRRLTLQYEVSCISVPKKHIGKKGRIPSSPSESCYNSYKDSIPACIERGYAFVIGTHRPSVEVMSFSEDDGELRILASGLILLTNTTGNTTSGCVPQDVRLVLADQLYVLSGLRNGMLLRFEWPTLTTRDSEEVTMRNVLEEKDELPISLVLISTRRIGITPVFLIPLGDSLDTNVIALSDRPWLLQTARQSLSYTSISFQPSTHATPVCASECPQGILFVAENSLHLVEMVHSKRLNVQKFHLGGTPRKVIYHNESKLLIVMRTDLFNATSDVCCVDPHSGSVLSSYKLKPGETGKSMELVRVGNEHVLVVGTSLFCGPAILPSGEAESTKGRLIVLCLEHAQNSDSGSMTFCSKAGSSSQRTSPFRDVVGPSTENLSGNSLCSSPEENNSDGIKLVETEAWQLRLVSANTWPGMIIAICRYLGRYFLVSAGNAFYVCGFVNDNPERMKRFAVGRTRFMITSLSTYFTRIAVGDCRDGILFFSYHEDVKKLYQTFSDPSQRLVADCLLMDGNTAAVSDRKGSIAILSCTDRSEYEYSSPESNLNLNCAYYMGEIAMTIRKGSFVFKLPTDDVPKCHGLGKSNDTVHNSIIAGTLLGSIYIFAPISREEFELLEAVQARLVVHPLTAPILGNDHNEFRSRENPTQATKILDGDMLAQFLELTSLQQESILSMELPSPSSSKSNSKIQSSSSLSLMLHKVVHLLERVHYALN